MLHSLRGRRIQSRFYLCEVHFIFSFNSLRKNASRRCSTERVAIERRPAGLERFSHDRHRARRNTPSTLILRDYGTLRTQFEIYISPAFGSGHGLVFEA